MKNEGVILRYILRDGNQNSTLYEFEVYTARLERKRPHMTVDNEELSQEQEDRIQKEVKERENGRSAQQTFKKMERQIRGHAKPNSAEISSLTRFEVESQYDAWKQLIRKGKVFACRINTICIHAPWQ
jgi:hypothetical protein